MSEINSQPKSISAWLSVTITLGLIFIGRAIAGDAGMWLIIFGCSIWMWLDAKKRDLTKLNGVAAIRKPFLWLICGLGLFIVSFPVYLTKVFKTRRPLTNSIKLSIVSITAVAFLAMLYFVGSQNQGSFVALKYGVGLKEFNRMMFCDQDVQIGENGFANCSVGSWLKTEHSIILIFKQEKLEQVTFVFSQTSLDKIVEKILKDIGSSDELVQSKNINDYVDILDNGKRLNWSAKNILLYCFSKNENKCAFQMGK